MAKKKKATVSEVRRELAKRFSGSAAEWLGYHHEILESLLDLIEQQIRRRGE